MLKIAIAGATGLIGKRLTEKLISRGDSVVIIGRNIEKLKKTFPNVQLFSDYSLNYLQALENTDVFINLAGVNVAGKRWNEEYKKEILDSRITTTKALINIIGHLTEKPKTYITASAIGYYGTSEIKNFTEDDKAGNDFLAEVCVKWEKEAWEVKKFNVRTVAVRIGIVLAKEGGALKKMLLPFYLFIGGPLGDGTQWFSWIHIDDLINIFLFAIDNPAVNGPINAVAPNPVRMKHFTSTLGKVLKRPSIFFVPTFILKLILGEASYLVTKGSRVLPKRLLDLGFKFIYVDLYDALKNLLKNKDRKWN